MKSSLYIPATYIYHADWITRGGGVLLKIAMKQSISIQLLPSPSTYVTIIVSPVTTGIFTHSLILTS